MGERDYSAKNIMQLIAFTWILVFSLAFVTGCDEPSQEERFAAQIGRVGTPPDATNIIILDEYWYTFEWKGQCFLGTKFYRNSALTKIDCVEE